jgi:FkbM family methyltransferase
MIQKSRYRVSARMMANSKIALHHVGGRWGNHPFPQLPAFAGDFIEVLYEADTDAIAAIHQAGKNHPSELIVVPACLSDQDGDGSLHIYVNPGLTSLHELGRLLDHRYQNTFGVDFDFGSGGARLLQKRKVATSRLDSLIASRQPPCPPPDFLSLDVQSGEYEVLLGARDALEQNICGLIVEVEFGEMYVAQRRFQDVHDLLDGAGFDFVRFLAIGETSVRAPLGFRGGGYQDFADALFLRRCDRVPGEDAGRRDMLTKLCFFALSFGVVELALRCIVALHGAALPQARAYQRFVAACRDVYQRDAKLMPPLFSAILPPHRIADYSAAASFQEWPAIFEGLRGFDAAYLRELKRYERRADSEFEALLRRHGLTDLAAAVKRKRRSQARNIRWAILQSQGRAPRWRAVVKQSASAIRRKVLGK